MKVSVLKEEIEKIRPSADEMKVLKALAVDVQKILRRTLIESRVRAEVTVGGSFAKGTIVKQNNYDVDILVRFAKEEKNLSDILEKSVKKLATYLKTKYERVHGSRDYFRVFTKSVIFEVIPVLKISRPGQEKNVTDLSYFHVAYVQKHGKKYFDDIRLAKAFCKAQGVYGAESYVHGFSGYALECLVSYYGGFIKMLKALSKIKERAIIDPARHYKNTQIALMSLNESKARSPIILVDPTYKGRNALAALNEEGFLKFQKAAQTFLSKPSLLLFQEKPIDIGEIKKEAAQKKADFVALELETNRQEGDIAGTKLKKFSYFLVKQARPYFEVIKEVFTYSEGKTARLYLVLKSRKEIIRAGPPVSMKEYAIEFKKAHKSVFEKDKKLYAIISLKAGAREWISSFVKDTKRLKEMGVVGATLSSL